MANKAMIMLYFYSAEPDMAARSERMHVVALPSPDIRESPHQPRLGDSEILAAGYFHVGILSRENMDRMAGPFGDGGVVGQVQGPMAAASRWAAKIRSKRNACGVCTARSRARGGVSVTSPSASICLIVSESVTPGMAAPWVFAAMIARLTNVSLTNNRAAS